MITGHAVFDGALTMDCGEGPEDFEYSNSTLLLPVQVVLTLDGTVLGGRVRSLADEDESQPVEVTGRIGHDGAMLSMAPDQRLEIGLSTLLDLELDAVHAHNGLLIGEATATLEKTQGDMVYSCALRGELELEPDRFEPDAITFQSEDIKGAVEVLFDEPVKVAELEISVEVQGREVAVTVEADHIDAEGFARSVAISPETAWPSAQLSVRVGNAVDVAGNVSEALTADVQVVLSR